MKDMTNRHTIQALDTVEFADFLYDQSEAARAQYDAEYRHFLTEWEASHDENGNPIPEEG